MTNQTPESNSPTGNSVNNSSTSTAQAPQARQEESKLKTHATIARDRAVTNLIVTVEFGDWLVGERTSEPVASLYEKVDAIRQTLSREETLKIAEVVLFEFLTLQQSMIERADQARNSQ